MTLVIYLTFFTLPSSGFSIAHELRFGGTSEGTADRVVQGSMAQENGGSQVPAEL